MSKREITDIMSIGDLIEYIQEHKPYAGLLFCFGSSFVSKIIQAKTRKSDEEDVPSHVAMIFQDHIYESTTEEVQIGYKKIRGGVRRWLLSDYLKAEVYKQTRYAFYPLDYLNDAEADKYIHLPYGKDIILDFLLKDGSNGESHGLICSQYANLITKLLRKKCPNPAELYRKAKELSGEQE